MVRMSVSTDTVVIELEGIERLWGLRKRLEIPIDQIAEAKLDPEHAARGPQALRVGGAAWPFRKPKRFFAGHYWRRGWGWKFWYVADPSHAVAITTKDQPVGVKFREVVVEVDNPRNTVCRINNELAAAS